MSEEAELIHIGTATDRSSLSERENGGGEKEGEEETVGSGAVETEGDVEREAEQETKEGDVEREGEQKTKEGEGEGKTAPNLVDTEEISTTVTGDQNVTDEETVEIELKGYQSETSSATDQTEPEEPQIEREGNKSNQKEPTSATGDQMEQEVPKNGAAVSSITFHELSYEVGQRKCFKKLPNKVILDSVRSVVILFHVLCVWCNLHNLSLLAAPCNVSSLQSWLEKKPLLLHSVLTGIPHCVVLPSVTDNCIPVMHTYLSCMFLHVSHYYYIFCVHILLLSISLSSMQW